VQNFRIQYERHLDLLRSHADAYDDGREHFAYEIATKIRVFVHDTFDRRGRPSSVSLLTHLGVKSEVGYVDWGPPETPPGAFSVGFGLCMLQMQTDRDGGTVSYVPARAGELDPLRNHPLTSFVDWWRLPVLESHVTVTRAEFVLDVCHQEGAHVDAKLNEKYARLTRQNALGVTTHAGGPPAKDIALASVRRIASELIETLERGIEWDGNEPVVKRRVCPLPYSSDEARSAGRNDPCPCGSGRKTKKCFDLRRPRNVVVIPGSSGVWTPPVRRPVTTPTDPRESNGSQFTSSFSFPLPPGLQR
jgi:hypothetical protein